MASQLVETRTDEIKKKFMWKEKKNNKENKESGNKDSESDVRNRDCNKRKDKKAQWQSVGYIQKHTVFLEK